MQGPRPLVVYGSRYGSTEQYARWVAEDVPARLIRLAELKPDDIETAPAVAFLSPVLAGSLMYAKALKAHASRLTSVPTALVTVGMVPVDDPERDDYIDRATPAGLREHVEVFHLRGAIEYGRLSLWHRLMMRFADSAARRQAGKDPTPAETARAEAAGKDVSYVDRNAAAPLVAWLREHGGAAT